MRHVAVIVLFSILLSSCSWFSKPEADIRFLPIKIEQPNRPEKLTLVAPNFMVITEANLEEKLEELKKLSGGRLVFFAYSPKDYENQSYNLQQLKQYIQKQKEIIVYYERVTEDASKREEN